ncbi:hypothetical protein C8Q76DRAFT_724657 [Earliella scabrosa]|nr:hypothetical protein C8Q76DRAFT_724657 [Earliella scabrosa]
MPPSKRRKTDPNGPLNKQADMDIDMPPRCYMTLMPLEMVSMILSHVPSPRDILALARTSKHFFKVLVNNKETDPIWRDARARCPPCPIPNFTPNFTEASFASLLFDFKTCEVCQKRTKEMYHSFALRARICDKPTCLNTWRAEALYAVTPQDVVEYPDFLQWVPRMERTDGHYGNTQRTLVRKEEWLQAINDFKKARLLGDQAVADWVAEKQAIADRMPALTEFYRELVQWSMRYEERRNVIRQRNLEMTATIAKENHWSTRALLRTPSYNTLHDARNRSLEAVTPDDFEEIREAVAREVVAHEERDIARETDRKQRARLDQVRSTLSTMKAKNDPTPVLPNLSEFRKLPVVKIFEAGPSGAEKRTMKDPFVASVLEENLKQWREAAKAALAGVLGFPGWKMMSRRKLHPVDRLTARFRCKRCDKAALGKNKPDDGGMDFARVCEHVCQHLPKKRASSEKWSAERFELDQRVIDAISQVLALCGTSAEDADSIRITDEVGDRVQCTSCSLIMNVASVGRHCKRHTECTFALVDAPAKPPIQHGLTEQLMSSSAANEKVYGCRHCAHASSASQDQQPKRLLTFNGLRSHVKEKHLIAWIADEDFFPQKDTAVAASSASAIDDTASRHHNANVAA